MLFRPAAWARISGCSIIGDFGKFSQQLVRADLLICKELFKIEKNHVNKITEPKNELNFRTFDMPKSGLIGSRIRQQRINRGLQQGALARSVGISPPYLNLIEHNRRRIAGRLLNDIARELAVDPATLSQGADTAVLAALIDASANTNPDGMNIETDRVEELAGRFPGWAALIGAQNDRIETLERSVMALTDRLANDPQLAASLHEVLSVATAIRSASAILARGDDVDPEWQARFHRNLFEDAQRLAQSAQSLVDYLDTSGDDASSQPRALPQEDLENWLSVRGYHIAELEGDAAPEVAEFLAGQAGLIANKALRSLAGDYLQTYRRDAVAVPMAKLLQAMDAAPVDPLALAGQFDVDLACIFRRLCSLPRDAPLIGFGLVVCDSSGTLIFRKPISGFPLPKFGAACPLWPLYQVLSRPLSPVSQVVEQAGHRPARYLTYAVAQPVGAPEFNRPQLFQASMLILPEGPRAVDANARALAIGTSCRICPRDVCRARREPSILTQGF